MYHWITYHWAAAPIWMKGVVAYFGLITVLPHIAGALSGVAEVIAAIAAILMAFSVRRLCKAGSRYLRDLGQAARIKSRQPDKSDPNVASPQPGRALPARSTDTVTPWSDRDRIFINRDLRAGGNDAAPRLAPPARAPVPGPIYALLRGRRR